MTSTDRRPPERCIDCQCELPGGGFCPRCLAARIRLLDKRFTAMLDAAERTEAREH